MKRLLTSALTIIVITASLIAQTNDFYDDAPTNKLAGARTITVKGEVAEEMIIDLNTLPVHSITVKETALTAGSVGFTGAYRYDGYSLYDILNTVVLKKKNEAEFQPIIDLFVEVTNEAGDKVVFSWGEIYYPVNLHRILIATDVARIVPSKSKELWPLTAETRLVAGNDLITVRNISNPVSITVRSLDCSYTINRSISPLFCEKMSICMNGETLNTMTELPSKSGQITYKTVFYGRGMGIHGTTTFTGSLLSEILNGYYTLSPEILKQGLVVIAGVDGYRAAFTLNEIANRNDQQEVLIIDRDNYEGAGRFSLFPAGDFFSDRAIKSIMEINLLLPVTR
jgi:hypothetical protein